jgi:hypothetical protein
MKNHAIKVGQTVFIKTINFNNSALETIVEADIVSIGKKWITLSKDYYGRFDKVSLMQDGKGYSSRFQIYLTKEEFKDEKEAKILSKSIREKIGQWGDIKAPLEVLRTIDNLLA